MEFKSLLKVLQKEYVSKKSQLEKLGFAIGAVSALAGEAPKLGRPAGKGLNGKPKKRRKMSAAARKAIGDAQRKRWAKQKAKG